MMWCFFKQKTAYEIYQCDWSSDVCSSDLPAVVITLPANGISTNGAVLSGLVTPGSRTGVVWFEWGTDTNYGHATASAVMGESFAPSAFSNTVTGLSPARLYHYRAVASNSLGVVAGADVSFVTA